MNQKQQVQEILQIYRKMELNMGIVADFIKAFVTAIPSLVKLNQRERDNIRTIVGELGDALDRSLQMTVIYLEGARYTENEQQLIDHLSNARQQLWTFYREFRICGRLYSLRDRLCRSFDPARYVIELGRSHEIHYFIRDLEQGERSILDDLNDVLAWASDWADKLRADPKTISKFNIALDGELAVLEQRREDLRRDVRLIIDRM